MVFYRTWELACLTRLAGQQAPRFLLSPPALNLQARAATPNIFFFFLHGFLRISLRPCTCTEFLGDKSVLFATYLKKNSSNINLWAYPIILGNDTGFINNTEFTYMAVHNKSPLYMKQYGFYFAQQTNDGCCNSWTYLLTKPFSVAGPQSTASDLHLSRLNQSLL